MRREGPGGAPRAGGAALSQEEEERARAAAREGGAQQERIRKWFQMLQVGGSWGYRFKEVRKLLNPKTLKP